jgi:hypothetical protein
VVPILSQIYPAHTAPSHLRSTLILSTHVLAFPVVSCLLTFPPIYYVPSSSPPFVLHTLPISSSLTWSFWLYLAKSISYDVFSNFPSLHPSSAVDSVTEEKSRVSSEICGMAIWFQSYVGNRIHLVVDLRTAALTNTQKNNKLIINQDVLLRTPTTQERRHIDDGRPD